MGIGGYGGRENCRTRAAVLPTILIMGVAVGPGNHHALGLIKAGQSRQPAAAAGP